MSKKPEANFFEEGEGMFTHHCRDLKTAIKAMQEEWEIEKEENISNFGNIVFDELTVKEERMYHHRACEWYTIGNDNICGQCGEVCGTVGRKTYSIYFN